MAKNDIDLSKDSFINLLTKYLDNAQEERDLALDRYRRQDDQIITPDDFMLQGKNAVEFLKLASNRSESIFQAAKEIKSIIFQKDEKSEVNVNLTDDFRRHVSQQIRQANESSTSMELDDDSDDTQS